jgi:hypothetical protein
MPPIKYVFVLMLENRSFDQMLGVSRFAGIDAVTQKPTQNNALPAGVNNSWNGTTYPAGPPAVDPIKNDPYHEFEDVLEQLCGAGVRYPKGGPYPAINNSGGCEVTESGGRDEMLYAGAIAGIVGFGSGVCGVRFVVLFTARPDVAEPVLCAGRIFGRSRP